jgi:hypothetical protein
MTKNRDKKIVLIWGHSLKENRPSLSPWQASEKTKQNKLRPLIAPATLGLQYNAFEDL